MARTVLAGSLQLLAMRGVRGVFLARICGTLAWQMLAVVVGWQVYAITHDALALGLVGLSDFLAFVAFALPGGHAADRLERRRLVAIAVVVQAACALALCLLSLRTLHGPLLIYALVAACAAARAFSQPTSHAMLPGLVPPGQFATAVAMNSMLFQSAVVVGPMIGGALFLAGAPLAYGACALLFLAAAAAVLTVDRQPRLPPSQEPPGRALLEGVRFVWRTPLLLGVISLDLFAVLLGGATALLPVFARDILHAGPLGLGLLRAAPGVGALLAASWLALRPLRDHAGAVMFVAAGAFGLCMILFGLSRSFPLTLLVLVASGCADMVSVYVRGVVVPRSTPDRLRGRVAAVNSMFIGASNELGEFESGVTARWLGTVPSVVIGGALTIAVVVAWSRWFPQLRRLRHLH